MHRKQGKYRRTEKSGGGGVVALRSKGSGVWTWCCIADLPPCRSSPRKGCNIAEIPRKICATLQTFPRKICNIADLPRGRFATLHIFPLPLQIFHGGRSATLQIFSHFVKFRILIFGYIENRALNHNRLLYMQYLKINDKTIIFSYVNDGYFSIKLRQLIGIRVYKDKTYNGWNVIRRRSAMGGRSAI